MIHFKHKETKEIRAFNSIEEAKLFIDIKLFDLMSDEDVDKLYNPEKYLSDEEKLLIYRQNMPTLSPIEFDIKLVDVGLYDQVQDLIQSDIKLRIAYTRATFFSRLDPFVIQASEALGLTPERVDELWMS